MAEEVPGIDLGSRGALLPHSAAMLLWAALASCAQGAPERAGPAQAEAAQPPSKLLPEIWACVVFVLVSAVIQGVAFKVLTRMLMRLVEPKPWWPRASVLQQELSLNYGCPKEDLNDTVALEGYSLTLVYCGHHFLSALAMMPVVVLGSEAAGARSWLLFLVVGLLNVGVDVSQSVEYFFRTFFPRTFSFLGIRVPVPIFILTVVLHHMLSMTMMIPMLLYHSSMRAFHIGSCSQLTAAGTSFLVGAYKFTLDTEVRSQMLQFRALVLVQFLTIWFHRGAVWFSQLYSSLCIFHAQGDTKFLVVGGVVGVLMSCFNCVMMYDAWRAADKWLLKPLLRATPEEQEGAKVRSGKMLKMGVKLS